MKLTAKSNMGSDATTAYDVTEYKSHTAAEFVDEVLATYPSEWGNINLETRRLLYNYTVHYKKGKLATEIPPEWYKIKIKFIDCSGGWGNMDYRIFPDEETIQNTEKSPFNFDILGHIQNKLKVAIDKQQNTDFETKSIPKELYNRLRLLGIIPNEVRSHNVGCSDYARHTIQPWAIWMDWELNAWDADIVKRVLRTKETESRISDYKKIIHDCQERIRQLNFEHKRQQKDENDERGI